MSCHVGHKHGLDLALLWLWHRLLAIALIRPLAWEPSYAVGMAQKRKKEKKKKEFSTTWMELETLILYEISQKEKEKYHMISLISGI